MLYLGGASPLRRPGRDWLNSVSGQERNRSVDRVGRAGLYVGYSSNN